MAIRASVLEYSMFPTLLPNEFLLFDRLCYKTVRPKRRDIVLVGNTWDKQKKYVKRIVGIPGDQIAIRDGILTINESTYTWSSENISHTLEVGHWTLGKNYYFLLGDALEWSLDSRSEGPVHFDSILGRARMVYWPLSKTRTLN